MKDMKVKVEELKTRTKVFFLNLWDRITTAMAKFLAWVVKNRTLAIFLFSSILTLVKNGCKIYRIKKEEEWRYRRFYDRRTDRWSYARRRPNKRQEEIIERRYRDGETYRSILDDMGLLK